MKGLLLLIPLLITMSSSAQDRLDQLYSMSIEELLQVKVTASTLTPETLKSVPSAVTVFNHRQIEQLGLDNLYELMNLVPGFQYYRSSYSPLLTNFSSRGRRIGSPSAEVLILVNGQRLESPRSSGSSVLIPYFPLSAIDQIEIIRGPGSSIYGSNAMLGVINITTRTNANEVGFGYGSFDRTQGYLHTSQEIGEASLNIFGHLTSDNGDDYKVQDTFSSGRITTDDPRTIANLNIGLNWKNTQINLQHNEFRAENFYEFDLISNNFNERSAQLTSVSVRQSTEWQSIESHLWLSFSRTELNVDSQFLAPGALALVSAPASSDALFATATFDDYEETRIQWHNDWYINQQSNAQFGIEIRHIDAPKTIAKNNFDLGDVTQGNSPIRYYGSLLATTPVQDASRRDIVGLYGQYQHYLFDSTHI